MRPRVDALRYYGFMNCEMRNFSELVTAAKRLCVPGQRHLLEVAGAPGAGKSTLAARSVAELNESLTESFDESLGELRGELYGVQLDANPNDKPSACQGIQSNAKLGKRAVLLSMDGYHLSNWVLEAKQLRNQKGSSATLDATGHAEMLRRLKVQQPGDGSVYAPMYHRELEEAIAAEIEVTGDIELAISEGSYLLVQSEPWSQVAQFFTEIWYLESDDTTRMSRLVKRHIELGKDLEFACQWVYGSGQRNADFIAFTKYLATRTIALIDQPGDVTNGAEPFTRAVVKRGSVMISWKETQARRLAEMLLEQRREYEVQIGVGRKLLTGWLFRLPVSRRSDSS